jgi:hypothetical protein
MYFSRLDFDSKALIKNVMNKYHFYLFTTAHFH